MIFVEPNAGARMMIEARLAEGLPDRAKHLVPIWRAVTDHDVSFATVMQDEGRFTIPETRPAILLIGDDLDTSKTCARSAPVRSGRFCRDARPSRSSAASR